MIGLDTNVIVRYLMQDDAKQSQLATKLIEGLTSAAPGYISLVTIVELVWVLRTAFELSREQIWTVVENLLEIDVFRIEKAAMVGQAVDSYRNGNADLADCLIERSSFYAGCDCTMTFDKAAAKTAKMVLIR